MIPVVSSFSSGFSAGFGEGAITRLGPGGIPRCLYGSFEGKVEAPPVVEDVSSRGGIWPDEHHKHVEPNDWRRKSAEERRRLLEQAVNALNQAPEEIREEAAEIVEPYAPKRKTQDVQVARSEYKRLSRNYASVERLITLYAEYIAEDDEIAIILLSH